MNYYESLLRRVEILEQLYFEGAKGDDGMLYDDFYGDLMEADDNLRKD